MRTAISDDDATCPRCGGEDDIVYFVKDEGSSRKLCYTHDDGECGCEWTEWEDR